MRLVPSLIASAALFASIGAHAVVTGSLTAGPTGTVLALTTEAANAPCSTGPEPANDCALGSLAAPIATINGGTVYFADLAIASQITPNTPFLAAGPSSGTPVLSFANGTSYLGFRWGSPDDYNTLTIRDSNNVDYVFTAGSLGFSVRDGNQSFSQYVQFIASAGTTISTVTFASTTDAFETTQFTISPIPEPETYALLLAGLGALGFVGRRRRNR
jgi:hypothetical protein